MFLTTRATIGGLATKAVKMVNILMLKNLCGLKAAVEIAREHEVNVSGVDFEWERDGLLGEYDVEVGFGKSEFKEYENEWVMQANQWCKVSEKRFFGMLLRKKDLDLNFLVRTVLKNRDSRQLVVGGGADETKLRRIYFEMERENMNLIRFIRPQFDKMNMIAVVKGHNRLFDLFGRFLKRRNPDLHVFVKWNGLVWVDGRVFKESRISIPIIGANEELEKLWKVLFKANYIPSRRNPKQAKNLMTKKACATSKEGKWQRFLVESGIEKPLTDFY